MYTYIYIICMYVHHIYIYIHFRVLGIILASILAIQKQKSILLRGNSANSCNFLKSCQNKFNAVHTCEGCVPN